MKNIGVFNEIQECEVCEYIQISFRHRVNKEDCWLLIRIDLILIPGTSATKSDHMTIEAVRRTNLSPPGGRVAVKLQGTGGWRGWRSAFKVRGRGSLIRCIHVFCRYIGQQGRYMIQFVHVKKSNFHGNTRIRDCSYKT